MRQIIFLPAATKLGQGNVFTGVCDSVNRGGRVSASVHAGMPDPLLDQAPPEQSRPPPDQAHPSPREQTPEYGQ